MITKQSKLLKTVAWLLVALCIPLSAVTLLDWKTQIKNMPPGFAALASASPGMGTVLAFNGSSWVANLITPLLDPGSNGILKRTGAGGVTAIAAPGTDYFTDPGSNGIMKRTALFTSAIAAVGTDYMGMATKLVFAQSPFTTKGDVWGTDGAALNRLGIGSDGTSLTADSTATNGFSWKGGVSGTNSKASRSTNLSINSATVTAITFDSNDFDNGGVHSTSVNPTRFTVPVGQAGKYDVKCEVVWNTVGGDATLRSAFFRKNGTASNTISSDQKTNDSSGVAQASHHLAVLLNLADSDYMECYVQQNNGGAQSVLANLTWMSMIRLN